MDSILSSENLNTKCSAERPDMKRKKLDAGLLAERPKSQTKPFRNTFIPIYNWSFCQEPRTTRRCVTIVILLPTGITPGDFKVRVGESGDCLDISATWPNALTDMTLLHCKWLSDKKIWMFTSKSMVSSHPLSLSVPTVMKTFYRMVVSGYP